MGHRELITNTAEYVEMREGTTCLAAALLFTVRLEATESELFHPSTVSFLKDYAFTSVNMSSRMDMPDNFATDSHPASSFGRRPIVVRFVESLKLPYIDGLEHVLKERKLGLWDRLVSLTPRLRFGDFSRMSNQIRCII